MNEKKLEEDDLYVHYLIISIIITFALFYLTGWDKGTVYRIKSIIPVPLNMFSFMLITYPFGYTIFRLIVKGFKKEVPVLTSIPEDHIMSNFIIYPIVVVVGIILLIIYFNHSYTRYLIIGLISISLYYIISTINSYRKNKLTENEDNLLNFDSDKWNS